MNVDEFIAAWKSSDKTLEVQTSGSTGRPKRITVEKERMRASARMTCDFLGLQEGQTALLCMSVEYIAGKMMVVRALERKMRLVTVPPCSHPLQNLDTDIDLAAMVPMQVWNTLQVKRERDRLRRIRHLIIGGGAISSELELELQRLYEEQRKAARQPTIVWSTYGMTETLSHIALRHLSGPGTTLWYTCLPDIRLCWTSETHSLVIDAPRLCPEWLYTHDIVEFEDCACPPECMSPRRRFRILGRTDNTISSAGIKIQLEEVEALLRPHLGNTIQATFRPDKQLGQALVLLTTRPLCRETLQKILAAKPYWMPREVRIVDALPQTATGKPDRAAARQLAEQELS